MRARRILILVQFLFLASLASAPISGPISALAQAVPVNGEVTRINLAENKITLRHSPIPNLDMDAMAGMVFIVADPAMLNGLKPGDRVVFEADRVNGRITVTRLSKAR